HVAAGVAAEEEQVAGSHGGERDLLAGGHLLAAVARKLDAAGGVGRLHQTGTVDAPRSAAAPLIRAAAEMIERPVVRRHAGRLDGDLDRAADFAVDDRRAAGVREDDLIALHYDTGAERQGDAFRQATRSLRALRALGMTLDWCALETLDWC